MFIFHNQIELFNWIRHNRPPISEISGKPIPNLVSHNKESWCFAHIIGKGPYPKFKLYYKNIVLCLPEEHTYYDNYPWLAKKNPQYQWVFELADVLRQQYAQTNHYFKPCYVPDLIKMV